MEMYFTNKMRDQPVLVQQRVSKGGAALSRALVVILTSIKESLSNLFSFISIL